MSKIHYATGGLITPERSEFNTLCGRKFPKGTDDIMQSGAAGARNVTCRDCRKKLDDDERKVQHRQKIESVIARGEWHRLQII